MINFLTIYILIGIWIVGTGAMVAKDEFRAELDRWSNKHTTPLTPLERTITLTIVLTTFVIAWPLVLAIGLTRL